MNIDESLYKLPVIGSGIERSYSYFRKNMAVTDVMHVLMGLGIAFLITGGSYITFGVLALVVVTLYHVYALYKEKGTRS